VSAEKKIVLPLTNPMGINAHAGAEKGRRFRRKIEENTTLYLHLWPSETAVDRKVGRPDRGKSN